MRMKFILILTLIYFTLVSTKPKSEFSLLRKLNVDAPVTSAVYDSTNRIAYLGTYLSPAQIIRVNLTSFQITGKITLEEGENYLRSAVIDSNAGFAYFGTDTVHGKVVKIDLKSFKRFETISLTDLSSDYLRTAVIDTKRGFAYFGTNAPAIGQIIRIRLSDFTYQGTLELHTFEDQLTSATIDEKNGFAYFGTSYAALPGNTIIKIDLEKFERVDRATLSIKDFFLTSATIDTMNGFAYFGTAQYTESSIVKVQLSNFTIVKSIGGFNNMYSAIADPKAGYVYFGSDANILRVKLATFEVDAKIDLIGEKKAAFIDNSNGIAYFLGDTFIVEVNLSETCPNNCSLNGKCNHNKCECSQGWTSSDCSQKECPENCSNHGSCDNGICYCNSLWSGFACHWGVNTTLTFPTGDIVSGVMDQHEGFVYFGTNDAPGKVIQLNVKNLEYKILTLEEGENYLRSAVIDSNAGFAYFGTDTVHGKIVRVNLKDFARVDSISLTDLSSDYLVTAVIDTKRGFAYFGTNAPAIAQIIRIRLSDFTYQGTLELHTFEDQLTSATIDEKNGFAYFGTSYAALPGNAIIKIDLEKFERVDRITLGIEQMFLRSATIDHDDGFAYFGTAQYSESSIVKIRLDNFSLIESLKGFENIYSATSNSKLNLGYFGTDNGIIRVDLNRFQVDEKIEIKGSKAVVVPDYPASTAYFATSNSVLQTFLYKTCGANCNRNGICNNGTCECFEYWKGNLCQEYVPPSRAPNSKPTATLLTVIIIYFLASLILFFYSLNVWRKEIRIQPASLKAFITVNCLLLVILLGRATYFTLSVFLSNGHIGRTLIPMIITACFFYFTLWLANFWYANFAKNHDETLRKGIIRFIGIMTIAVFFTSCMVFIMKHSQSLLIFIVSCVLGGITCILWLVFFFHSRKVQSSSAMSNHLKNAKQALHNAVLILGGSILLQIVMWYVSVRNIVESIFVMSKSVGFYLIFVLSDTICLFIVLYTCAKLKHYYTKPDSERFALIEPVSPSANEERATKKRLKRTSICLIITLILLTGLGIAIFFLYPRYPSWQIEEMTFQKFKFNEDVTVSVEFDVGVEIHNPGYTEAKLITGNLNLFYENYQFGLAKLGSFTMSPRATRKEIIHVTLPSIGPTLGAILLAAIVENDGILPVHAEGSAKAEAMGLEININVACLQVIDTYELPSKIVGSSCKYSYGY